MEFFTAIVADWGLLAIISLVIGIVIALVFGRWRHSAVASTSREPPPTSRCTSPSCARCNGEDAIRTKLLRRLEEHAKETYNNNVQSENLSLCLSQSYSRLLSMIDSQDHKKEILTAIYKESGQEGIQTRYLAHVWMIPELSRRPLWTENDHQLIKKLYSVFQDGTNFGTILEEYKIVSRLDSAWKENNLPTGKWRTYFLMNQGIWDSEKSSQCPQTRQILESSQSLMEGAVYGNVLFSALCRGSVIEPHTAPCNFRLRCHLALNASSAGFRLRVGRETAVWETGKLLVFDDSFVHSVEHLDEESEAEVADRVVLIFDIWHPEITTSEQNALNYMFAY